MELQAIIESIKDLSLSRGGGRQWDRPAGKPRTAIDPTNLRYRLGGNKSELRGMGEEAKISIIPGLAQQPRLRAADSFLVAIRQIGDVEFELDVIQAVYTGNHSIGRRALFECAEQCGRPIIIALRSGDWLGAPPLDKKYQDKRVIAANWVYTFQIDQPLQRARGDYLIAKF
jgi:hypothetical protein